MIFSAFKRSVHVCLTTPAIAGVSLAFLGLTQAAGLTTPITDGLRDSRYCEVISVTQKRLSFIVEVYNTLGFNDCPTDLWRTLDSKALAEQMHAKLIKLNGPRHWTLDAIQGSGISATSRTEEFGGIKMGLRATITTKLWQGTVGDKFFTPNKVNRKTVFHYKAGSPVFELVSPTGDVYMMQSYSQIVDSKLMMADLPRLAERLKLPAGWKYQTRNLTADYELKADGIAYVINDNLLNSYQRRQK